MYCYHTQFLSKSNFHITDTWSEIVYTQHPM
jgi:hypothetical protein